jgi:hypothetical protein
MRARISCSASPSASLIEPTLPESDVEHDSRGPRGQERRAADRPFLGAAGADRPLPDRGLREAAALRVLALGDFMPPAFLAERRAGMLFRFR